MGDNEDKHYRPFVLGDFQNQQFFEEDINMTMLYISRHGDKSGPFKIDDVHSMLERNELRPDDLAWHEGMTDWKHLSALFPSGTQSNFNPQLKSPLPSKHSHESHDLREGIIKPIIFPFSQKKWIASMWWLPIINYIPIIDLLILRGWRLEIVRRKGLGFKNILPELMLFQFFKKGMFLWCMSLFYLLIPMFLISVLGVGGIRDLIGDIRFLFEYFFIGNTEIGLMEFLRNEARDFVMALIIDLVWAGISLPLYRSAMVHYAVTGKLRSFINFPGNIAFVIRNLSDFFKIWAYAFLIGGVLAVGSTLLAATGVGAILIPLVTLPMYYWITGYEYGELAAKVTR